MQPRTSLTIGATLAAGVALILALVPGEVIAALLSLAPDDATTFLVRRYAASATAAMAVTSLGITRGHSPQRSALLGLATWFGVQALIIVAGLATGVVGGLAWLAALGDPALAAWFAIFAHRARELTSEARDDAAAFTPS